jgi:hypothetical protein
MKRLDDNVGVMESGDDGSVRFRRGEREVHASLCVFCNRLIEGL